MTTSTPNERAPDPRRKIWAARSHWLLALGVTALAFVSPEARAGIYSIGNLDRTSASVALVVGNSDYEHVRQGDLSAKADAEAVARSLADIGFDVTTAINLNRSEFIDRVIEFHDRSRVSGAALLYYSGYATSGRSFEKGRVIDVLLPVDAWSSGNVVGNGVDVDDILAGMDGAVNLLVLDASMRARPRIQRMNTVIAYAGEMALAVSHEDGYTGAFTKALLDEIAPRVDVVDMLQAVIESVSANQATTSDSKPWMESSLRQPYRLPGPPTPLADKLDARLLAVVEQFEVGGMEAASAYGAANGIHVENDHVTVRIIADSEGDVERLKRLIETATGSVGATFENNVYASLPVAVIGTFARAAMVYRMDLSEEVVSPPDQAAEPPVEKEPRPAPARSNDDE